MSTNRIDRLFLKTLIAFIIAFKVLLKFEYTTQCVTDVSITVLLNDKALI